MKKSLETRKGNVLSINDLLKDFKAEGELTSGNFPQAVGEKIGQLNVDWQIIIRLALALKERPVEEDMVVAHTVADRHQAPISFDALQSSNVSVVTSSLFKDTATEEDDSMDFKLECKNHYLMISKIFTIYKPNIHNLKFIIVSLITYLNVWQRFEACQDIILR